PSRNWSWRINVRNAEGDGSSLEKVLNSLLELQKLESEIGRLRCTQEPPYDSKVKMEELKRLRLLETEKLKSIEDYRVRRNQVASDLEDCRQRLMKAEGALKQIASSSVLQATMKEIERLKALEQELESKERSIEKESATIQGQISDVQAEQAKIDPGIKTETRNHTEAEIILQIKEMESLRAEVISRIPVSYTALYERLIAARAGLAVVEIQGTVCGGCHMILPPQFLNSLKHSSRVEQCPKCHRI